MEFQEEKKENRPEELFTEMMTEDVPKLMIDIKPQIQEALLDSKEDKLKKKTTLIISPQSLKTLRGQ